MKRNLRSTLLAVAVGTGMMLAAGTASAAVILSPTSAIINVGGPGSSNIIDTLNQAGLLTGFTSGVTDFDTYLAGNPLHSLIFAGNEWFATQNTTTAQVTYNLGGIFKIDALALWNEDADGIGLLDLFSSTDGVTFSALSLGLLPTNNPIDVNYPADVFSFSGVQAQFIRFDMSGCPQAGPRSFGACAIGEVAFRVPEPATLTLFGFGLVGLGFMMRRRRKTV